MSAEQRHSMLGAKRDPEPVLPELLRTGWRRSGRAGRAGLVIAGAIAVAVAAWLLFGQGGGSFAYSGPAAPPFSISWDELDAVEPRRGELLRLESESRTEVLTIEPLQFEASGDEPVPGLALAAADSVPPLVPVERLVLEGRTELAVDRGPEAYQLAFTAPAGGGSVLIGKRFLVPDPDRPGRGVEIEITEISDDPRVIEKVSDAPSGFFLNWPIQLLLEDAASVRTAEGLEEPLRSFAFG